MKATATVSTQDRITIPVEVRKKYNIKPGTRVAIEQKGNAIRIRPVK